MTEKIKINLECVKEFVVTNGYTDLSDELFISEDGFSLKMFTVNTIDSDGLYDALSEEFETQLNVIELGNTELNSNEEELFNEWKSINGLDEEDCDDSPYIYEINIEIDDDVIGDIVGNEWEKLMDDGCGNYVIYDDNICDDNIYDVLEEYGISRDRVNVYTNEMRYFSATEVNIEINY